MLRIATGSVAANDVDDFRRVAFFGEILRRFELEDRRPQAVKHRSAAIDLDAEGFLRPMADKDVRARVDAAVREVDGKIGQLVDLAAMRRGE